MILKKDDKVIHKNYKDNLEIVSHVGNDWYLCYSKSLRHSVVLHIKELKKV